MEFEHYEYKGISFPVRVCDFTYGKSTIRRKIGSEVMSQMFFDKDSNYVDEQAKFIDEQIAYYVPHDVLMKLSSKELFDYIFYHIDESIIEEF